MRLRHLLITSACLAGILPSVAFAQNFTDVTSKTYEKDAIATVINKQWMTPLTNTTFGYGTRIMPDDWLRMLMFLRTPDACPELGTTANAYWTTDNIRNCLSGAGVPITTSGATIRRDEAMQQLFALRRQSFAFQQLQTKPADFVDPSDLKDIPENRRGAMIAAIRLKLLFRSSNNILPAAPLLREDAALAVTRFHDWESQGGVASETKTSFAITDGATMDHWRDLDTDIWVARVTTGKDAEIKPILPRRSFSPVSATSTATSTVRDEFVYEPVSSLAKNTGARAAINGSYFNVQWPWGALEDVAIIDGKTTLMRTDRSTFIVCANGAMYVQRYDAKRLTTQKCTPTQALGAGPLFLAGGSIQTTSTKEGFDEYTAWERRVGSNARTAIGVSADHRSAYLIVVAGKAYPAFGRGGNSLGTFLRSKYPDLTDAMMFDGGNSTTLVANDKTLVASGQSGNTTERPVVSALGIFSKKDEQAAAKLRAKNQRAAWSDDIVKIKIPKPATTLAWQSATKSTSQNAQVTLTGSRGTTIKLVDAEDHVAVYNLTFDLIAQDATSSLIVTRREGVHEKGWHIPTEIHVINPKDKSDTDLIRLFSFIPAAHQPDLKTLDVIAFRPTGIILGDATGSTWYYYAKDKQLSPAKFPTVKKK